MRRQTFKTTIDAAPEKVWDILWSEATYPLWTAVFSEGSKAQTDWQKGSKAIFLNAENDGMVSTIVDNIPNHFMSIKHLGIVKDGVEIVGGPETQGWYGSLENYTLQKVNGQTELSVEMDVIEEYEDYFLTQWPKALEAVKELAERRVAEFNHG